MISRGSVSISVILSGSVKGRFMALTVSWSSVCKELWPLNSYPSALTLGPSWFVWLLLPASCIATSP